MSILTEGHPTIITFANYPSVAFEEKEVTPPGVDGGGANDTTTMRNTAWRTQAPKVLKTLSECSFTAAYDPAVYDTIVSMVNENQLITVTFSDGQTVSFWGWLDTFVPARCTEGAQPEAEVTIQPSNQNASGEEVAPVVA